MRITPDNIESLKENEIFVFGSNELGLHGGGAALTAVTKFEAIKWKGWGKQGQSFALPTKDWSVRTLELGDIQFYVNRFEAFVKLYPELTFLVTEVGCGLAGYTPSDIGPLFKNFVSLDNVYLPERFLDVINE